MNYRNRWLTRKTYVFNTIHGRMSHFVRQVNIVRENEGQKAADNYIDNLFGPPEEKDWLTNFSMRYFRGLR